MPVRALLVLPFLGKKTSSPIPISSVQAVSSPETRLSGPIRVSLVRASSESPYPPNRDTAGNAPIPGESAGIVRRISFCQCCGGKTKHEVPDGEEKMRAICTLCGKIAYENPKMVVGCLIEHEEKVLLCKRNIEPSSGLWTLPAGYMEIGESAAEAGALDSFHLGKQTYIIFLARMQKPHFSPGPESSDCQLFSLSDIPFDSLAFSSIFVKLKLYIEDVKIGRPGFHYGGIINKMPGSNPSDMRAFTLNNHLHS
ncbi:hypothetical protein MLD38_015950 [Melastoma candidum]|uniref:Uncharacterized protein n=1 Tax=Melastoma candidum TaxID=119954 RepID=A0ACB9RIZ8_9MYRT|nr:hypothetical protein MLD38_015950 [Melastoma candidum]